MNRVYVLSPVVGICHMIVCAEKDVTDAEVLEVANRENPSGTSNGWSVVLRSGEPKDGGPIACADDPERLHLMVEC